MKSAEEILNEHCHITFNKYTGEEEIESSLYAVIIAMEEYAEQFKEKQDNANGKG